MSKEVYPYRVDYPRSNQWWDGHWADLSNWCNQCIGAGNWEYFYGEFVFTEEKYRQWFILRWQ